MWVYAANEEASKRELLDTTTQDVIRLEHREGDFRIVLVSKGVVTEMSSLMNLEKAQDEMTKLVKKLQAVDIQKPKKKADFFIV